MADGTVVIECFSDTHPSSTVAPVAEVAPLFWQCVATVFDITPSLAVG